MTCQRIIGKDLVLILTPYTYIYKRYDAAKPAFVRLLQSVENRREGNLSSHIYSQNSKRTANSRLRSFPSTLHMPFSNSTKYDPTQTTHPSHPPLHSHLRLKFKYRLYTPISPRPHTSARAYSPPKTAPRGYSQ